MTHVTFETAKRLKEAGFPQPDPFLPDAPITGSFYISENVETTPLFNDVSDNPERRSFKMVKKLISLNYAKSIIDVIRREDMVFAQTATDILAHLPGWYLTFSKNQWVCLSFDEEGSAPDSFIHDNPAEAAAEAWFFEQSHAKK